MAGSSVGRTGPRGSPSRRNTCVIDGSLPGVLYLGRMHFAVDPFTSFPKKLSTPRAGRKPFHVRNIKGQRLWRLPDGDQGHEESRWLGRRGGESGLASTEGGEGDGLTIAAAGKGSGVSRCGHRDTVASTWADDSGGFAVGMVQLPRLTPFDRLFCLVESPITHRRYVP